MEKYRWYRRKRAYYWSELLYPLENISTRGYSSFGLARPQVGEDLLRSIHPHLSLLDQDLGHAVDFPAGTPWVVFPPGRGGRVPAGLPRRISVGSGLDGPPVVPRRNDDRVDTVHDALVVGRAPERVGVRKRVRLEDSLDDVLSGDVLGPDGLFREHGPGADETPHREVRDDPEVDAAARPLLDVRRDRLRHRVDGGRPHRVAAVDNQVGDHHVSPLRIHDPDLDVLRAAAELHEHRILLVRDREDFVSVVEDRHPRPVGIRDPDKLDLPDHDRTRRARREPTSLPRHPSRVRGGRVDARVV